MAETEITPASSVTFEHALPSVADSLTPRAVVCAVFLGTALCFANMYLGLQAGTVNAMPMQTALLGFALFRSIQHHLSKALSPAEITVIEVVAGALGLAPFTSGFTSVIPALEFLAVPAESGLDKQFSVPQLLLWSLATCFLGTVVAAPLRQVFILRERLRFPSATATGTLIGVLYGKTSIVGRAQQPTEHLESTHEYTNANLAAMDSSDAAQANDNIPEASDQDNASFQPGKVGQAVNVLLWSLAGSSLFVCRQIFQSDGLQR